MAKYECGGCGYIYDEDKEGKLWKELPDDWICPSCFSPRDQFKIIKQDIKVATAKGEIEVEVKEKIGGEYLSEWSRNSDDFENHMADIHRMAETGESIIEPMRTRKPVISWDDILIKGSQLARLPLDKKDPVNTRTIIGKNAKHPIELHLPVYISHMSFGALSKEIKIALAKGSAAVRTAICSGEGGILPEEMKNSYKYIFEYIPNEYSVNEENLRKVDAIEIKIGQGTKPGMGGHLPGNKVTSEIAKIRGKKEGEDVRSPAYFKDIRNKEELKAKVEWLRKRSGGKPIGVKIAAGHIEEDLEIIIYAKPDFITIDGRGGATGSSPKYIKDATSIPTLFALHRAREFLDNKDVKDISLIITGGLRVPSDFVKALALGADAVAIATSAMIAAGCQQYRLCNTGKCPVGIATQDPKLRKRLKIEISANRVANFLKVCMEELMNFARITGNDDVHGLSLKDICTTNSEISDHTKIEHVGGIKND